MNLSHLKYKFIVWLAKTIGSDDVIDYDAFYDLVPQKFKQVPDSIRYYDPLSNIIQHNNLRQDLIQYPKIEGLLKEIHEVMGDDRQIKTNPYYWWEDNEAKPLYGPAYPYQTITVTITPECHSSNGKINN